MEMQAARLDKLDEIMKSLADRIRVTSSILIDIQDLVRGTVEKNVSLSLKHPAVRNLFADVKNCETTFQSTEKILETIKEDSGKSIITEGKREKTELTTDKIKELTGRFKWIGMEIQDRKINLQIRLSVFQQSIKPTKPDQEFRDVIADLLRDLRTLATQMKKAQGHVTQEAIGKPANHPQDTDKSGYPYEASKSTVRTYGVHNPNASIGPHFIPVPTSSRGFPMRMITDYQPRYAGWRIQKGPNTTNPGPKPATDSWKSPTITQLLLSNEELYLETRFMDARRVGGSSKRSFLQDILDKLSSEDKRFAITELVRKQNWSLQSWEPDLEWRMAGLRVRTRAVSRYSRETEHITVILKTELKIPPPTGWPPPHRGSTNPGMIRPPGQASQAPGRFPVTPAANIMSSQANQRKRHSQSLPHDIHANYVSDSRRPGHPSQNSPQQDYSHDTGHPVPSIPAENTPGNPRPSSISQRMMRNQTKRKDTRKEIRSPFVVEFQHPKQNWRVRVREYGRSGPHEQEMMAAEEDQIIDEMLSEWQEAMSPENV
ncbi:hypothetical protein HBI76_163870 [Parastagonospora nodorum]|nr:hypothetical protein HBI76_163870 [Parastagonospora nodorum]